MAPSKAARSGPDEGKADAPTTKEKSGSGAGNQSATKMRRVASGATSNLREATNASAVNGAATTTATDSASSAQEANVPGWPAFERDVLHAYRRAYRLKTPTAFVSDHHAWVLTQPGSIGLYSPTIARHKQLRRQTKDQLTNVVRKHFNGLGVQENDVIVDFLHKVRSEGISKARIRRSDFIHQEVER
ncbi:8bb31583-e121-4c36-aee7-c0847bbc16dd [Thermothielavioides terrestris]|uniref:8bb31583-e121-4c36-aee7-c0847bbc16dd n=1 Tax=Thermothielavioides terrestris TaxID=2587410 RepID=A0A446BMN5_9PEZI|nr:8bb31583-e121-4c36-aee7-c0847bbc16dd [Thermothielavioides terrestris]